jgi:hypothetical protein
MSNSVLKFILKISLLSLPVLVPTAVYFVFDPFKVLYNYQSYYVSGEPSYVTLNRDYVSTETFIHKYPIYKYDSFIFGNSRSIVYEINDWKKYISSDRCYHFDATGETVYGIYRKIDYLKKNNIGIKNALIILDYSTLESTSDSRGHLFMKHPVLSGKNYCLFQLEILKEFFDLQFLGSYLLYKFFNIKSESLDRTPIEYNSVSNEIKFTFYENIISRNPDEYYLPKMNLFYTRDTAQKYSPMIIKDEQKRMLSEISNKLKADNADYKVIINPLYDQLKLNPADAGLLNSIFGKEHVYDFAGINKITEDFRNYYERSHYRPHVARMILSEVYKTQN